MYTGLRSWISKWPRILSRMFDRVRDLYLFFSLFLYFLLSLLLLFDSFLEFLLIDWTLDLASNQTCDLVVLLNASLSWLLDTELALLLNASANWLIDASLLRIGLALLTVSVLLSTSESGRLAAVYSCWLA